MATRTKEERGRRRARSLVFVARVCLVRNPRLEASYRVAYRHDGHARNREHFAGADPRVAMSERDT